MLERTLLKLPQKLKRRKCMTDTEIEGINVMLTEISETIMYAIKEIDNGMEESGLQTLEDLIETIQG